MLSPSMLILGGAVGVGVMLLIVGLVFERRQKLPPKSADKPVHSRLYEHEMRGHRNSFIWTGSITALLVAVALLEWSTFDFAMQWPSANAYATRLDRFEAMGRRTGWSYSLDVEYYYDVKDSRYSGSARFGYDDEAIRDQIYTQLNGGGVLQIWYHPLFPFISLANPTGPVFALVMFGLAALTGLGVISSGMGMLNTWLCGDR